MKLSRSLATWNFIRSLWIAYLLIVDVQSLARFGDPGSYPGFAIDQRLLLTVSALPAYIGAVIAGLASGRTAQAVAEALAALIYLLVAVSVWRQSRAGRVVAIVVCCLDLFALLYSVCFFVPSISTAWPELHTEGVLLGLLFLTAYSLVLALLLLPRTSQFFVRAQVGSAGNVSSRPNE